jgi:hypothetical protein
VLAEIVRQAAGLLQRDLQRQKIQVVLDLPPRCRWCRPIRC